jgi:hypothetical protein
MAERTKNQSLYKKFIRQSVLRTLDCSRGYIFVNVQNNRGSKGCEGNLKESRPSPLSINILRNSTNDD